MSDEVRLVSTPQFSMGAVTPPQPPNGETTADRVRAGAEARIAAAGGGGPREDADGFAARVDDALASDSDEADAEQGVESEDGRGGPDLDAILGEGPSEDDVRDAVRAMRRARISDDRIREIGKLGADVLVDLGRGYGDAQAADDDAFRRGRADDDDGDDGTGGTAEPTLGTPYKLPDDVRAALEEGPAKSLEESITKHLVDRERRVQRVLSGLEETVIDGLREKLVAGGFRELANDKRFERVRQRMASLAKTGDYSSYADVMRAAARLERTPAEDARRSDRGRDLRRRDVGQMPAGGRSTAGTRRMTWDGVVDYAIDELARGRPVDDVRRQVESMRSRVDPKSRPRRPSYVD